MFDFDYWFASLIGTCEIIVNKDALRRAWLLDDRSKTSIYSYDELFEQLAGDLHIDECIKLFKICLQQVNALEVVTALAQALHKLNNCVETNTKLQNPNILLSSAEWASFQDASQRVLQLPVAQSYCSNYIGS